ncbi:hypothetical protein [Roseburia sp. AF22-8AC]|nr:hypothetical protein [Roseburia sp. AF22-8AC]
MSTVIFLLCFNPSRVLLSMPIFRSWYWDIFLDFIVFHKLADSKLSKNLEGEAGFPDFVVLERKKSRDAAKYGCIEAKRPYDNMEITEQIEGHLNSYGKVIYTNGLIWKFYKVKEKPVKEFCLGCIDPHNQDSVIWEPVDNWYKLMSFLEDWNWKS